MQNKSNKKNILLLSASCLLLLSACTNGGSSSESQNSSVSSQVESSTESSSESTSQTSESSSSSPSSDEGVKPTKLSTNFSRSVIGIGEELVIDVVFAPENTTLKNLKLTSTNPAVVSVDSLKHSIKGVAASSKAVTITIKSADNADCSPITLSILCSKESSVVDADKAKAKLAVLAANEEDHISNASIKIDVKTSPTAEAKTFTNTFVSYDNHSYNNVVDYDGKEYLAYRGYDDDYLYEIKYDDTGKITDSRKYVIYDETSSFSSTVTSDTAKERSLKAALYAKTYSSKYTYGIADYLDDQFLDSIYDTSVATTVMTDSSITITYNKQSISYVDTYKLVINFDGDNYKSVSYAYISYDLDDVDENFAPLSEDVTPRAFDKFEATVTTTEKKGKDTTEGGFEPKDLFFTSFSLNFYDSSDETNTPATSFTRGTTITYKAKDFLPAKASSSIDTIYVTSVEDTSVLSISQNYMALNAIGEGTTKVTFASRYATYTAELTVTIQAATGIKATELPTSMLANDSQYITVEAEPYGALDDFDVTLTEESKKYATLEKVMDGFYKLSGNPNMAEKEGNVTIVIQSRSNTALRKELTTKVMRALTSQELFEVLTTNNYISEKFSSYNMYAKANFTSELTEGKGYKGTYTVYHRETQVYDTITFYYAIGNGKLSVVEYEAENKYLDKFSLSVNTPDGLSLYSKISDIADTDYEDGDYYSVKLTAEETSNE